MQHSLGFTVKAKLFSIRIFTLGLCFFITTGTFKAAETNSVKTLKKLSLEELFNQEVTSATGIAEKLSRTAAAIDVLTQDQIRRSGATSIPKAIRLATGIEAA